VSDWQVGDKAVCVVPIGDLQLGCTYTVSEVLGSGRYMRDSLRGRGLNLAGITPPFEKDGFDARRFLRGEPTDGEIA
jgi:hypothetical protein